VAEQDQQTVYDFVGGKPWFDALVERFYAGVEADEVLRPLYPEADLAGARERLSGFLVQYWGGPADYSAQRGHPRLRMRHAPYAIGALERDRWLVHMRAALDAAELHPQIHTLFADYFEQAANAMVNRPD